MRLGRARRPGGEGGEEEEEVRGRRTDLRLCDDSYDSNVCTLCICLVYDLGSSTLRGTLSCKLKNIHSESEDVHQSY